MRKIILLLLLPVFSYSQPVCSDGTINTYFAPVDSHWTDFSCGIYLKRDTTNNVTYAEVINDVDHKPLNVDTAYIDVSGSLLIVKLSDTFKYVNLGIGATDESTIGVTQLLWGKQGEPALLPGGYKLGASVKAYELRFAMTRTGCLCGFVRWDSTNNVFIQEAYTPRFATLNSTPFDITFTNGYLDIKTHNVIEMTGIPMLFVQGNNGNPNHVLYPQTEYMSKTWSRTRFYKLDGTQVMSLPHNLTINFNFGNADIPINIRQTRFGSFANIWVSGRGAGKLNN